MPDLLRWGLVLSIAGPLFCSLLIGLLLLARQHWLTESAVYKLCNGGLLLAFAGSVLVLFAHGFGSAAIEVSFGEWVRIGSYEIPALLYVDRLALVFSLLGSALTLLVARFSQTYLHKEAGYA